MNSSILLGESKSLKCNLKLIVSLATFLVLASFFPCFYSVQAQDPQNLPQLKEANIALQDAFIAVSEAEQTGASVTTFLDALRAGADILTQAEMSDGIEDIDEIANKIESATEIFSEVETDAKRAKDLALASSRSAIFSRVVILVVSEFLFVLVLFLIWKQFKQYYAKRSLDSNLR